MISLQSKKPAPSKHLPARNISKYRLAALFALSNTMSFVFFLKTFFLIFLKLLKPGCFVLAGIFQCHLCLSPLVVNKVIVITPWLFEQ
ncbi:hypothetical protein BY996DRAFT_6908095 [Phakopsora pachyrhizi]|nr:hypothetical protein BY996DRAFT_6908095 [Phakopsora pachyrhizi]